jgi:hypothetical protein
MAHRRAIGVVTRALTTLLYERHPRDEFGTLAVEPYQAKDFGQPLRTGISVFLWRVTANTTMRALPPRRVPDGTLMRPSLPLDLHYCITPWAENAETQHRLLGWLLRALEDLGPLPAEMLNHFVGEEGTFVDPEALQLVLDPLSVGDYLSFWDRLKDLPLSAHYVARLVLLDSDEPVDVHPPVAEREFQMARLG